ncbi:protein SPEAR3-like [Actinidia eriantha]|uniref:protein SPEAR3-like n=1 Tax=Actinidia eriantha TaxID=165200 RepID=UPI002585FBC9|nr:protein SPEAR3-like [Actinidia eriantha]
MDSGYFGERNLGNERSPRKGKKGNSDNKPKQPQRGLGVAQLEKIRLNSQMANCSYLPNPLHASYGSNYHNNLSQEDMRMQTSYSSSVVPSSSSFSYTSSSSSYDFHGHQNIMMGLGESERTNIRFADYQPSTISRQNPSIGMLERQHFAQPSMTRHFLNQHVEGQKNRKKDRGGDSVGSGSQNSETSDTQELDLELRLSL